jgi:hypothetical protein
MPPEKVYKLEKVDSGDRSLVIAKLLWSGFCFKEVLYVSQLTFQGNN